MSSSLEQIAEKWLQSIGLFSNDLLLTAITGPSEKYKPLQVSLYRQARIWNLFDGVARMGQHPAGVRCVEDRLRKITNARNNELQVLYRILAGSGPGKDFVVQLLDSFTHHGPNGSHLCIVTELAGPNLAEDIEDMEDDPVVYLHQHLPPALARRFAAQVIQGV
ncbi:hypothetical protein EUX98_g9753 [Antrodiella citrinella]|uniref:non-specific serine/threonine protein kinase n=1 Tax=Antrodiella citrinella TaxID=2447956 RepID=A0A4V3XED7_9APHY|nr:hypothetical protein EUX98_g9753 [Antrodiella citrinella]